MFRWIILLLGLAVVAPASGANWQWSGWTTITQLYATKTSYIFSLSGVRLDPYSSCANQMYIKGDYQEYESMVATLLMAYTLEKEVTVYFDADATGCSTLVDRFRVQ